MKLTTITFVAGAALASFATAETVAPADVQFDEYGAVAASLTGVAGDAANGRKVFMNRKKGNCLACHVNDDMSEQSFHGEVGPELNGVADRWETAELRGIVVNAKKMFDGTIMPAFYRDAGFNRTLKNFDGKSILSAQEVEDLLAYISTLKE
ncbi:MAG: sulfur oxidation c-type cytochrome SoxX [Proteobacteria bacterium]|nr:MAG: sulfur oxidation c-type cytochrome SoxX [Pseudomonadota bacterium]